MVNNRSASLPLLNLAAYKEEGFLIVKGPAVTDLKNSIRDVLKKFSLRIAERFEEAKDYRDQLGDKPFADLVDWCVANEKEQRISRAFYELWSVLPEIISLADHPLFIHIVNSVGLSTPIPGTLPAIRIDRPRDMTHLVPTHQDFWFSMLSDNSAVFWLPLVSLDRDMGLLRAIPGSHKNGLIPFKKAECGHNPFTTVDSFSESDFVELSIDDDELLVFSQFLIHKSGQNQSHRTRVTMQVRYNDFDTLKAMTSSFTPGHSRYVRQRWEEILLESTRGGK